MKKNVLFIILVGLCATSHSQFFIQPTDTIVGRSDNYYYRPYWYDDCDYFQDDTARYVGLPRILYNPWPQDAFNGKLAEEHYAQQPLQVWGVAAMVSWEYNESGGLVDNPPANPWRGVETLYLMEGDSLNPALPDFYYPRYMRLVDSTRWDTSAPKLMRMPMNIYSSPADTTGYLECYVYEAMFDHPLKVYDTFYIVGTYRSNVVDASSVYPPAVFRNYPTSYFTVWAPRNDCDNCRYGFRLFASVQQADDMTDPQAWMLGTQDRSIFGPFLPIIRTYDLTVTPSTGGIVEGTGSYPAGWWMPLTAIPAEGYVFSQWSDGNTDNPRNVYLVSDTTLTAIFLPE